MSEVISYNRTLLFLIKRLFQNVNQLYVIPVILYHPFLIILYFMVQLKSVALLLLFFAYGLSQSCNNPTTIVQNTFLGNIFNQTFGALNYVSTFQQFISNPNLSSLQTYLMAQAPYLIPLWCLGGITLLLTFAFCIQLCSYNCCRVQKCGNKISLGTYKPSSVSCSVYIFFFFSLLLIALGIATFILASDLIKTSNNTLCNAQQTFNYIYSGTPAGVTPSWSGVDNLQTYANQVSINFPNAVPTINTIFAGDFFSAANSTSSTSLFADATASFNCPNLINTNVTCPFTDKNNCPQNSISQIPVFSQDYCNSSVSTSAAGQIADQQNVNSTAWNNNLAALSATLTNSSTMNLSFASLVDSASTLATSFQNFEPALNNGINSGASNIHNVEIGTYAVLSLLIFLGLFSFLAVFCVFCSRNFGCRYVLYPLWIIFAFFSIVMFLLSSVLLFGSFTSFGACIAYNDYTHSQSGNALQSLSFYNTSQFTQILNTCYYTSRDGNIFDTFNLSTSIQTLQQISINYNNAIPAPVFISVVTNIQNQLKDYYMNPNKVSLVGQNSSSSPQTALNQANNDNNGGNASCSALKDTFQYNPNSCYPLLINQNPPTPSCILINSNNNSTYVANRTSTFNSTDCSTYRNNYNSLLNYGNGIQNLTSSYLSNSDLSSYLTAYFNYYEAVVATMNPQVQALFNSFLTPLTQLTQGSSCSFVRTTLDSFVNNSCNTNFPYIYAISILVIAMSCCFFFLMILSYFLTTRIQYYTFVNGDLSNYKEDREQLQSVQIEMSSYPTNRQQWQELLPRK